MLFGDPQVNAYRQERTRRRNANRSPRFPGGGGSWGSVDRQHQRGFEAFMDWAGRPTLKDSNRLI